MLYDEAVSYKSELFVKGLGEACAIVLGDLIGKC